MMATTNYIARQYGARAAMPGYTGAECWGVGVGYFLS